HCKVTSDRGGLHGTLKDYMYYHVNYRTYAKGTSVQTFTLAEPERQIAVIRKTAETLAAPRAATEKGVGGFNKTLEPGETWPVIGHESQTGMALDDLVIRINERRNDQALRAVLLSIAFDGETTVNSPLGDFFGSSPGLNAFTSLPMGVSESGECWS